MKQEWKSIKYEIKNQIVELTIDRPDKLNALNSKAYEEIGYAARLTKQSKAKGMIVTGQGQNSFAAGADIKEMCQMSCEKALHFGKLCNEAFRQLELLQIPVIAAVNGYALGGGCELALACHARICVPNAVFGLPEVTLGVIPGSGGTQRLSRLLGAGRAKELLFTGRKLKSDEALNIGLVSKIIETENLLEYARNMIEKAKSI